MYTLKKRILAAFLSGLMTVSTVTAAPAQTHTLETETADASVSNDMTSVPLSNGGALLDDKSGVQVETQPASFDTDVSGDDGIDMGIWPSGSALSANTDDGYVEVTRTDGMDFAEGDSLVVQTVKSSSEKDKSVADLWSDFVSDGVQVDGSAADDEDLLYQHALSVASLSDAQADVAVTWKLCDKRFVKALNAGKKVYVIAYDDVNGARFVDGVNAEIVPTDTEMYSEDGILIGGFGDKVLLSFVSQIPVSLYAMILPDEDTVSDVSSEGIDVDSEISVDDSETAEVVVENMDETEAETETVEPDISVDSDSINVEQISETEILSVDGVVAETEEAAETERETEVSTDITVETEAPVLTADVETESESVFEFESEGSSVLSDANGASVVETEGVSLETEVENLETEVEETESETEGFVSEEVSEDVRTSSENLAGMIDLQDGYGFVSADYNGYIDPDSSTASCGSEVAFGGDYNNKDWDTNKWFYWKTGGYYNGEAISLKISTRLVHKSNTKTKYHMTASGKVGVTDGDKTADDHGVVGLKLEFFEYGSKTKHTPFKGVFWVADLDMNDHASKKNSGNSEGWGISPNDDVPSGTSIGLYVKDELSSQLYLHKGNKSVSSSDDWYWVFSNFSSKSGTYYYWIDGKMVSTTDINEAIDDLGYFEADGKSWFQNGGILLDGSDGTVNLRYDGMSKYESYVGSTGCKVTYKFSDDSDYKPDSKIYVYYNKATIAQYKLIDFPEIEGYEVEWGWRPASAKDGTVVLKSPFRELGSSYSHLWDTGVDSDGDKKPGTTVNRKTNMAYSKLNGSNGNAYASSVIIWHEDDTSPIPKPGYYPHGMNPETGRPVYTKGDLYVAPSLVESDSVWEVKLVRAKGKIKPKKQLVDNSSSDFTGGPTVAGWTFSLGGVPSDYDVPDGTTRTSGSNGEGAVWEVPVGSGYKVTETGVNTDLWDVDQSAGSNVTVEQDATTTVTIKNTLKLGSITIKKKISDLSGLAQNETFTFNVSGTSYTGHSINKDYTVTCSNGSGQTVLSNVPYGVYTITEKARSDAAGWDTSGAGSWVATVNKNSTAPSHEFTNIYMTGNLIVTKTVTDPAYDTYHGTGKISSEPPASGHQAGYVFRLHGTSTSGRAIDVSQTTGADGKASFLHMPIGTYTLEETRTIDSSAGVPSWWDVKLNGAWTKSSTVVISYDTVNKRENTTEVDCTDIYKTGNLVVLKNVINPAYDTYHGTSVVTSEPPASGNQPGYVFRLHGTSTSGKTVDMSLTTGSDGKATFSNVPIGTYTLDETRTVDSSTTVPDWWDVKLNGAWSKTSTVTISYNDTNHIGSTLNVDCTDVYKTGNLVVLKNVIDPAYDTYHGTGVLNPEPPASGNQAGYTFRLHGTSRSGKTVDRTVTTGADGKASFPHIPIGTYTLDETKTVDSSSGVPDWWDVKLNGLWTKSVTIEITYNTTTHAENTLNVDCTDIYKTGNLDVSKVIDDKSTSLAIADKNKSNIPVKFTFELAGTSRSGLAYKKSLTAQGTVGTTPKVTFPDVPISGSYTLTETATIDGSGVQSWWDPHMSVSSPLANSWTKSITVNLEYDNSAHVQKLTTDNVTNVYKTGNLTVHKTVEKANASQYNASGENRYSESLAGFGFHLYGFTTSHSVSPSAYGPNNGRSVNGANRDGKYVDMYSVTDANGNATFNHIPIGTYIVEEVSSLGRSALTGLATSTTADDGRAITQDLKRYVLNPPQIITITYDDANHRENNHNLYFHNYLMKWKLTAHKEDFERIEDGTETTDGRNGAQHVTDLPADREATLQGAKYNLFDGNKLIATYTTDEYGYFTTDTFVCGDNWYLQEASASEGYLVSTTKYHIYAEYDAQTIKHDNTFASPHNTYHHNSAYNPASILPNGTQTSYTTMPNGWLQSGTTMQTGEISGLPNYQSIGMKDLTKSPFYAWNSNGRANGEHWADLGGNTTSVNNNTVTVVANNKTTSVNSENRDHQTPIADTQVVGNNVFSPKNAMYEPVHKASVTFLKVSDDSNEADPDYLAGAGFTYYNAETVWKKVIASPQYADYIARYRAGELSDLTSEQLGWIKAAVDGRTFTKNAMTDDQITQCCFDCLRNDATQQYDGMRGTLPAIVYAYPNDADVTSHKLVKSFTYAGGPTVSAPQGSVVTQYIANEIFSNSDGRVVSPRLPYGDYLVFETTVPDVNAANRYIATTPRIIHVVDDDKDQTTYLDGKGDSYKDHVLDDLPPSAVIRITKKDWTTDRVVLKNGEMYGPRYVIHDLDGAYFDLYMEDRTTAQKEQYRALFGDLVVDMAASDRGSYAHPWTSIFYNEDDGSQHAYIETPNLPHGRYEIEEVFAPLDYVQQSKEGHYRTDSSGKTFWEIEARGDEIYAKDGVTTHLHTTTNDVGAAANNGYSNSPRGNFKSERVRVTISSNTILYDSRMAKFVVDATQYNDPVIGKVSVYTEGQFLKGYTNTGSTITERIEGLAFDGYTTKQTDDSYFVNDFKNAVFEYEAGPVPGAVYEIRAKEDIYSNEGYGEKGSPNSKLLFKEGDLVTTLTTDKNGKAWTKDVIHTRDHDYYGLPIGRYTIAQTTAGNGFALSPDNAVPRDITIEYAGQDVPIVFKDTAYYNPRQAIDLAVCKYDIETQEKISGSVFGLYADQDFKDRNGNVVIAKDTLLLMAETTEQFLDTEFEDWYKYDNTVYHKDGLPLGKYYIREVNSPKGYTTTDAVLRFDASYRASGTERISFRNTSPAPHLVSEDFAFVNEQTKLVLKVLDYDTLVELDGAKITLRNENGDSVRTEVSVHDGGAVIRRLELNRTYTLEEIEPRFGYCSEIYPEQAPYQSRYARDGAYYSKEDDKTYRPATDIYANKTDVTKGTFSMEDIGGVQLLTIRNQRVKANIELIKKGDVPTATFNSDGSLKQVTYEFKGIPGTHYDLVAVDKIVHPDGYSPDLHAAGETVASVVTDNNGRASFKDLYLGKYEIVETKATEGFYRNQETCRKTVDLKDYYNDRIYGASKFTDHAFTWSSTTGDELIAFENPRITVGMKALKLGYDEGRTYPVAGAEFTLYARDDIKDPWGHVIIPKDTVLDIKESGEDGYAVFRDDLPIGAYYAKETKRPFGYYGSDAVLVYDFTQQAKDDTTPHYDLERTVRNPITKVIVYLRDNLTDNELADAELVVSEPGGKTFTTIATINTSGDGHVIKGLDPGVSYKITETKPRFAYMDDILNKDGTHMEQDNYMHFTIEDVPIHADLSNVPDATVINLYNAFVTGKITVTKTGDLLTDLMTSSYDNWPSTLVKVVRSYFHYYQALLTGAEFTVTAVENIEHPDGVTGVVVPEGTVAKINVRDLPMPAVLSTDKGNLVFSGMYLGHYELRESEQRQGFKANNTVTPFTLAYIDKDTPEVSALPSVAEYVNERQRAEVEIIKVDSQNQKVLPGAVFGIYSAEDIVDLDDVTVVSKDTLLETQMTGSDGKASFISDFPLGMYYIKELWAPTGYTISDKRLDVDITWKPEGGDLLRFSEQFDDGSTDVYVKKVDAETGAYLPGALLAIYEKTDDGVGAQVTQWTSALSDHLVQNLSAGHKYVLRELSAPEGYAKADDVEFTVTGMVDGKIQTIVMKDDPIRIEIKVWEVPYEGDPIPLAGIPYGVYDNHNKLVYTVDGDKLQFVSTEDVETAEKVPAGNYTGRVSSVPSGYVPPANTPIDVLPIKELQHFDIYIPVITIKITASDGETGENIPEGVVIDIIGTGGKVIKSNVPLTYLETHYPAGTYTLKVKEVPEGYLIPADKTIKVLVKDGLQVFDIPLYKGAPPTEPTKDVFAPSAPTVSIDNSMVQPGQMLLYKVTYKNTTGKAVAAQITDAVPEYTTYVEGSAENGGVYTASSKTLKWSGLQVADGKSVTVSFMVKVDDTVHGEVIVNHADVFDGKNTYQTNETHNPTPETPKKDVFDSSDANTSIDGNVVNADQELLYKVTYHNTGMDAVDVVITDVIPAHTEYVADSADHDGKYTASSRTLVWTLSADPDETVTVSFKVKVDSDVNGEVIRNKAKVNDGTNTYDTNETKNPTGTDPYKDVFRPSKPTVSIDGNPVKRGEELLYKVFYHNSTNGKASVVITDEIPAHTSYVAGSADMGGSYDKTSNTITWSFEAEKDADKVVSFRVKVDDDNMDIIYNDAKVVEGDNEYQTNQTVNPPMPVKDVFDKADLTTSIDKKPVAPGQELVYTVSHRNASGSSQTVSITDVIPQYTTYVDGSADNGGSYDASARRLTWTLNVPADTLVSVSFHVTVDAKASGRILVNEAQVRDGENTFTTNAVTNPVPQPVKDVFEPSAPTVSIDGQSVKAGQELLYKVTYENALAEDATVVITDVVPEYTTYVPQSADEEGVYEKSTRMLTWTRNVPAGGSITVSFRVKVDDNAGGQVILNDADVNDGKNTYRTNETRNPVPSPEKDVFRVSDPTVSIDGKNVGIGEQLLYTVTYKNITGHRSSVTITDTIPAHTTYVDGSADKGGLYDAAAKSVTWTASLADGESVTVRFAVTVDEGGYVLKNRADVMDGENTYSTNETQNPVPKKDVFDPAEDTVSIDNEFVKPGAELLYKVSYRNVSGEEQNVVITDEIPQYTTYVDGSADNDGVYEDGVLTWTASVPDGESWTVSFKVRVNDDANGVTVVNDADVMEGENVVRTNETKNPVTEPVKDVFLADASDVSIDGKQVQPGMELMYTVSYTNPFDEAVTAKITDKIPAHTTYVDASASMNGVYDAESDTLVWSVPAGPGETVVVLFNVKVNDDAAGHVIVNEALVEDGYNTYTTNETKNPVNVPVKDVFSPASPEVSIDKKPVKAGDELLYKVTYENVNEEEVTVRIVDAIPEHTSYVEGSADNGGVYSEADNAVAWEIPVAAGKGVTVSFKVVVNSDAKNVVIVNAADVDDGTNKYRTNETKNPVPAPEKKVFSAGDLETNIDGRSVSVGETLVYEISYTNLSETASVIEISDSIPAHTKFVSADNGGTFSSGSVVWKVGAASGEEVKVSFTVEVLDDAAGSTVKNRARIRDGANSYTTNETKNPVPKKDVFDPAEPEVSIDNKPVRSGDELLYKISYENATGKDVTVVITDEIPAGTSYVEASADNGGVYKDGVVTWSVPVANGAGVTVSFKVLVLPEAENTVIENTAIVDDGVNRTSTNTVTNPVPAPKKDVFRPSDDTVSIDKKPVAGGEVLLYKVFYTNLTGAKAHVAITDVIPEHTTYEDGSVSDGGVYDGSTRTLSWAIDTEPGESIAVSFRVRVDAGNKAVIENTAVVDDGTNSYTTNTTKNPPVPVKDVFDPADDKTSIDGHVVKAGQELLYKVFYTNATDADAAVTITDAIPKYTTYVDGSADMGGVYKDGVLTWNIDVKYGESAVVSFKVVVNDDTDGNLIENTANVNDGVNEFTTNTTKNPPDDKKIRIQVRPVDKDTWELLPGTGMELIGPDGETVGEWTADGWKLFEDVVPGEYIIHVTDVPDGYIIPEDMPITVLDVPELQSFEIPIEHIKIQVRPVDKETGNLLPGVEMQLKDPSGKVVGEWTSEGWKLFDPIPAGEYTIHVVNVPKGYVVPPDMKIEVKSIPELQSFEIPIEHIKIQVRPVDKETGKLLPDVDMQLIDKDGNVVGKWTSEGWKLFDPIPAGEYVIRVTRVPDGYIIPPDTKITVKEISDLQSFEVPIEHTKIQIRPVDKETGKPLPDVDMQLIDKTGKVVGKWTSEGWKLFEKIPAGEYTIRVTRVPDGYIIPPDTKITVKNVSDLQSFEVPIEHIKIRVRPVTEEGELLKGVKIQLISPTGKVVGEWTSDGWKLFEKIVPGQYTIHVVSVPDGYEIPADKVITVKSIADLQSFEIVIPRKASPSPTPVTPDGKASGPDTGDMANRILLILTIAMAGLLSMLVYWKRRRMAR